MSNDEKPMTQEEKSALIKNVVELVIPIRHRRPYQGPPSYNQGPRERGRPIW